MLIAFSVENFRSFSAEQIFSFASSSDRSHESTHCMRTGMRAVPKVSKSAVIFGANASGKTNMLAALATFRDLILHSTGYSDDRLRELHTPFRFGPTEHQPTRFEIDVLLGTTRYRYSLSHDARRITAERLLVYRTGKSQRWFERRFDPDTQRDEWLGFSPHFNGPRKMWRKATRPTALFLTAAAQLNSDQLAPLVHWVEHSLEIVLPADLNDLGRAAAYVQNEDFKERMLALLRAVDIPVEDVRVAEREIAPGGFRASGSPAPPAQPPLVEFLYAHKGWVPVWLDSAFEAAGTQRLFALLGPLLTAIDRGRLLLIDEFDTGLHPLIARFLVQIINDPETSSHGAQLVLITHNTTLMDLDILRRDEIWLMELDANRASVLTPLLRSTPRKRELIAKCYLLGLYGAVPSIRSEARVAAPRRDPEASRSRRS